VAVASLVGYLLVCITAALCKLAEICPGAEMLILRVTHSNVLKFFSVPHRIFAGWPPSGHVADSPRSVSR